jgi:hypothetical protein
MNMNQIDVSIYAGLTPFPQDISGWNGNSHVFGQLIEFGRHENWPIAGSYWKICNRPAKYRSALGWLGSLNGGQSGMTLWWSRGKSWADSGFAGR